MRGVVASRTVRQINSAAYEIQHLRRLISRHTEILAVAAKASLLVASSLLVSTDD